MRSTQSAISRAKAKKLKRTGGAISRKLKVKTLWEKTRSDPMNLYTLILTVSTVILTITTILLWCAGEAQRKVSEDAVTAANEANSITTQQFKMAYRPLLEGNIEFVASDPNGIRKTSPQILIVGIVRIKNLGETAAILKSVSFSFARGTSFEFTDPIPSFRTLKAGEEIVLDDSIPEIEKTVIKPRGQLFSVISNTQPNFDQLWMNPPPSGCKVIYEDRLGIKRELMFTFKQSVLWSPSGTRWGADDINYDRQIE
jgi:hypothetical protein